MTSNRQSKFVPISRHVFELKSLQVTQKALNSLLNGQVVVGKVPRIHYADGNMIIEIPPGGSGVSDFQVVSDGGDYYNAQLITGGVAGGAYIKVAKHQDLRCILPTDSPAGGAWASKLVRGITYTYTYVPTAGVTLDGVNVVEYVRSQTGDDASAETCYVTPCLNCLNDGSDPAGAGDIISAFQTSFDSPDTLVGVTWQAMADGRAWAAPRPA